MNEADENPCCYGASILVERSGQKIKQLIIHEKVISFTEKNQARNGDSGLDRRFTFRMSWSETPSPYIGAKLVRCVGQFYVTVTKILDQNNSEEKRLILAHGFRGLAMVG